MSGQSSSLTRCERLAGRDDPRGGRAQHAPRGGHHHRGRDALVGDVADDDADLAVGQLEEVVEVAADLAGRLVVRVEVPAGQARGSSRGRKFCWISCATRSSCSMRSRDARLGRLAAHELGHLQRRRGLRGERVEQPLVVGRVLLVGEPRAEVERADQLAARDERHDQRHARGAQRVDGGRLQLEPVDLDHAAGASGGTRAAGRWARSPRPARPAGSAARPRAWPSTAAASPAGASPPLRITLRIACANVDISPSFVREERHGIVTGFSAA